MLNLNDSTRLYNCITKDDVGKFLNELRLLNITNPSALLCIIENSNQGTSLIAHALSRQSLKIAEKLIELGANIRLCGNHQSPILYRLLHKQPAVMFFLASHGIEDLEELYYQSEVISNPGETEQATAPLLIAYNPRKPESYSPEKFERTKMIFQAYKAQHDAITRLENDFDKAIHFEALAQIDSADSNKPSYWLIGLAIEHYQNALATEMNKSETTEKNERTQMLSQHIRDLTNQIADSTTATSFTISFPVEKPATEATPQEWFGWHQNRLDYTVRTVYDSFQSRADSDNANESKDGEEETGLLADSDHSSSDSGSQPRDSDLADGWVWIQRSAATLYRLATGIEADAKPSSTPAPTKDGSK